MKKAWKEKVIMWQKQVANVRIFNKFSFPPLSSKYQCWRKLRRNNMSFSFNIDIMGEVFCYLVVSENKKGVYSYVFYSCSMADLRGRQQFTGCRKAFESIINFSKTFIKYVLLIFRFLVRDQNPKLYTFSPHGFFLNLDMLCFFFQNHKLASKKHSRKLNQFD